MDFLTIGLGVVIILFGLYTSVMRIKFPEKSGKLKAMKDKFGSTSGQTIHTIAYTVMPVLFGIVVIRAGLNGLSIMQFIAI